MATLVEAALDYGVFSMFGTVYDFGDEAYGIMWPPAQLSRDWREVLSISRLLVVFVALFLGSVVSVVPKMQVQVPQPLPLPHLGHRNLQSCLQEWGTREGGAGSGCINLQVASTSYSPANC